MNADLTLIGTVDNYKNRKAGEEKAKSVANRAVRSEAIGSTKVSTLDISSARPCYASL